MRLTWSKDPKEKGLAGVVQGPRGATLKVDGKQVATVAAFSVGFHKYDGWYWYARADEIGVALRNTCDAPLKTLEEAKDQAENYVRGCLGLRAKVRRG